ncbi:MAG TPA: TIGR03013 family XrtA/PEP-CTERM system glycosyltransferase [Ideonella sp.]|nr:TIGR03013 family XrtA/PEP-CTERM system glycosyltransferase [Ideonella sp.]
MFTVFKHHVVTLTFAELLADIAFCFLAWLLLKAQVPHDLLTGVSGNSPLIGVLLPATAFALGMALLYSCVGVYRCRTATGGWAGTVSRALLAVLLGSVVVYLALTLDGNEGYASAFLMRAVPTIAIGMLLVRSLFYLARRAAVGTSRVLIVGTGTEARGVARDLSESTRTRHQVIGFYPTDNEPVALLRSGPELFSRNMPIDEIVRKYRVDEVIVAVIERRGGSVPMDQLLACRIRGVPVLDLAGFYERSEGIVPIDSLKASWLVYGHGFVQGPVRTFAKRVFDIVSSFALIAITAPIMVAAAIAIRCESRGPVIYRQQRVGLGGRGFMCLKFRSMRADAEKDGVARWATTNDSRITAVGNFMRRTRIDELPQLLNVLRGEMSLVGPRPERPSFVEQLREEIPYYDIRHSIKPGLTGWAQVRYRYGASVEDARKKHQFDLYYVKNNSLFLDLLVLIDTVSVVLFREGSR